MPDPICSGGPEPDALAEFLEIMRPRLRSILTRHAIPPADAEDLLQDTFLALYLSWPRIDNHEAWLSGTLRFLCCNYWRKKKRQSCESLEAAELAGLPELATFPQSRSDDLLDLAAVVAKLKPRYRRLLHLRYGLGMSLDELRERLGYSANGVRKLTSRALARARRLGEEARRVPPSPGACRRGKRAAPAGRRAAGRARQARATPTGRRRGTPGCDRRKAAERPASPCPRARCAGRGDGLRAAR